MSNIEPHHELVGEEYNANDEPVRLERDDPIEYEITLRYLERYVPDGVSVADIGVGGGQYSECLARRGCSVYLVDVSQRLLDTASARLVAAGLETRIAGVQRASATDLSHLPDASCDVVLLLGPLYHLITPEERRQAIGEAARLLRPGGLLFAAGINRLTYLRDVLRSDPDDFVRRRGFLDQLFRDGNLTKPDGQMATMHVTTVGELRAELCPPFAELILVGAESFASKRESAAIYRQASPETKAAIVDFVELTGVTLEGLGVTSHYLFIGRLPETPDAPRYHLVE